MDRVWTLLSVIPSFMWAYLRSSSIKVTKSRKGQTKNFAFGRRDECFLGQISVKNVKNGTITLLERPKSNKFQKSGKYRNRREQRENGCSRPSKHQNSVIFQYIYLKFCTQYTPDRVLSHVLPFVVWCLLKVQNISLFFRKYLLLITFISQFVKIWKIRDNSLIEFSTFYWKPIASIF